MLLPTLMASANYAIIYFCEALYSIQRLLRTIEDDYARSRDQTITTCCQPYINTHTVFRNHSYRLSINRIIVELLKSVYLPILVLLHVTILAFLASSRRRQTLDHTTRQPFVLRQSRQVRLIL